MQRCCSPGSASFTELETQESAIAKPCLVLSPCHLSLVDVIMPSPPTTATTAITSSVFPADIDTPSKVAGNLHRFYSMPETIYDVAEKQRRGETVLVKKRLGIGMRGHNGSYIKATT
ncbi:hypothetical protein V6N13_035573 [Hibiscus sabdariffa]|uniref:Uncharacterized protein n=1 Tax=Hibiscus sabdariffa TaxID=183260 RepID=A0ABR2S9A8_9ROSI